MGASKEKFMQEREKDRQRYSRGVKPSDFLEGHKLELAVYECELDRVRAILEILNGEFILQYTEERDTVMFGEHRYIFHVLCPTTNFASAYYNFGIKMAPIYKERKQRFDKIRTA